MNPKIQSHLFTFPNRIKFLLSILVLAIIGLAIRVMYIESYDYQYIMGQPVVNHVYNDAEMLVEKDGKKWLFGGTMSMEKDFDVTELSLSTRQFHYGIGREHFPALIEPEFMKPEETEAWLRDEDRVLAVQVNDEVKVYPIRLLKRHEIVNDVVGGKLIFAAYCYLADLGAVYDRVIGDKTFTFALSGYTYFDPEIWEGRDAFVFWDRETESLWWPPIGKGVSGAMNGVNLHILEPALWSQTTWGEVKKEHPNALILKVPQPHVIPETWIAYSDEEVNEIKKNIKQEEAIAPYWGENPAIGEGIDSTKKSGNDWLSGSGSFR